MRRILSIFLNLSEGVLLDIGCGTGRDVNAMSKKSKLKIVGIDSSFEVINMARKQFPDNIFVRENFEDLSLNHNYLTAVFAINVMHYLNYELAVAKIFDFLVPGGYFFVHFNLEIKDLSGKIDYQDDILSINKDFK